MTYRTFYSILLILSVQLVCAQSSDVWVISNIKLSKSDKEIEKVYSNERYSKDDVLIYHGNALVGSSKKAINSKIKKLRSKFDRVYIVPGDSDWKKLKSKELKSLGDYLDDEYKGDVIVPENACGAVEVKEINDDLSMVFVDSDWYFTDWSGDRNLNKKCEVNSREEFWTELKGEIGGLKAKQVLIFTRDPVFRNDELGGHLSLKQHLLPVPILGTIISQTRNYLSPRKNTLSPIYQEYISNMKTILKDHPQVTLITSDASVNSIYEYRDNYQINVNTSKKSENFHDDDGLIYQYDEASILNLTVKDEEVTATFLNAEDGMTIHSQLVLSGKPFKYDDREFGSFDASTLDRKVERRIRLAEDRVDLNDFFFGGLNKKMFDLEVEVEQLNLGVEKGGLTPLRLGGGMQTNSMRLADSEGNVFVTRSLKKMPEKALPQGLDAKPFATVMENFFMAADPLAFLVTPTLDSAANVYHTTPRLVLLPRQPNLSIYNDQIGGELVLFRERADDAWPNKRSYGYSKNIISTSSLIDKMAENKATPDARMFLRARLLDLVLGDWDRHQDQWRWAEGNGDKEKMFFPIARDRDQVFSNFDGLFITAFRPYSINLLQLRKFDDKLTRDEIRWMHWKSSILDNMILADLDENEWKSETNFMKSAITEDIVDKATTILPNSYEERKKVINYNLNARMQNIDQISKDLRAELLERSIIRGSNDKDSIVINQKKNSIAIDIYTDYKDEEKIGKRSYVYYESETKDVWIYGLEKDDIFSMIGENNSGIDLTLIGGYNGDRYVSTSKFKNITIVDDEPKEEIKLETSTKYRMVENKLVHDLTRNDLTPQYKFLIPKLMYDTDDGLTVGGAYTWIKRGFKSIKTQTISANYLTGRRSSTLSYNYNKEDLLTQMSTYVGARWSGVRRGLNYYGGNDSSNNGDNRFYQVGVSDIRLELGKIKRLNSVTSISGGLYGWSAKIEDTAGRFVSRTNEDINPEIFERSYFTGAKLNLTLQNSDSPLRPTKLGRISLTADYRYATRVKRSNIMFDFEYAYYTPLIGEDRLIFSTKINAGHIVGDYYLYEGFQLGGSDYLRGYRNGRFTGRSIVAQNSNLHLKLVNRLFSSSFKCSAGISGGFDHGRTWSDNDASEDWQYSYGGGVWISPLDEAVFSAGMYQNNENVQLRILFNWQF
ncbi:MAG: hypothetical protein ACJA1A_001425 [Saprospiraceae bacterium]|jgi:hypothetical protein